MARKTVLVVEDHADTREMYVDALSGAGLSTVEATNATHALQRATTIRPDIIVTDLRLGCGESGLELCEQLKRYPLTKHIPIIIIVTESTRDPSVKDRAKAVGCAVVLMKPVDPFALAAEVNRALHSTTTQPSCD